MAPPRQPVILLVDDEPAILAVIGLGLEQHGFRVVKAHSSSEALQRAKDLSQIDVLATDLMLPGALKLAKHSFQRPPKHGLELMRQMLALRPGLGVILFSGQPDEVIGTLGAIPAGTVFLRKPLAVDAFAQSVHQVLRNPTTTAGNGAVQPKKRPVAAFWRSVTTRWHRP